MSIRQSVSFRAIILIIFYVHINNIWILLGYDCYLAPKVCRSYQKRSAMSIRPSVSSRTIILIIFYDMSNNIWILLGYDCVLAPKVCHSSL